jgi:hypothetical protein
MTGQTARQGVEIMRTDEELLAEAQALDRAYAESEAFDRAQAIKALKVGTRVQLSTGQPRPKRGKWVIADWLVVNGQGRVSEIHPAYICVAIERQADGRPVGYQRTQVIPYTDKRFTLTPIDDEESVDEAAELRKAALNRGQP